jgi:hypothetical protein
MIAAKQQRLRNQTFTSASLEVKESREMIATTRRGKGLNIL